MKRKIVIIVLAGALLVATSAVSAFVGYRVGEIVGVGRGCALSDFVDAAHTLVALRSIREGDTDGALSLLELRLDGQIMALGHADAIAPDRVAESRRLLSDIGDYRETYPRDWSGLEKLTGGYEINLRTMRNLRSDVEGILRSAQGRDAQ